MQKQGLILNKPEKPLHDMPIVKKVRIGQGGAIFDGNFADGEGSFEASGSSNDRNYHLSVAR